MWYPANGSMANGSRLTCPTAPAAAAVVSDPIDAARYTPYIQLNAWYTRGAVFDRLPPKMNAWIGTPRGSSHAESITGFWYAGAVNRALGCEIGRAHV